MRLVGRTSSGHFMCSKLDLLFSGTQLLPGRKMTVCVILHNMIIESGRENSVHDTEPWHRQGPLA